MNDWVPIPGSARARLLDAALLAFEQHGYEEAAVIDIAKAAGVTTGSLYHHFDSKLGLFKVLRREMERRLRDRMEGAAAAVEGGREAATTALLVGFDAAVKLKVLRLLSETPTGVEEDTLATTVAELVAPHPAAAAAIMLGAWRAALATAAGGEATATVRDGLAWALGHTLPSKGPPVT